MCAKKLKLSAKKLELNPMEYASSMLQQLDIMRKDVQHCDFIIRVGSKEFPVHRNMLSAASDYFQAMLSHDTIEKKSGIVELKEVDAESVKKCIDYIYAGEGSVDSGEEEKFLHAAHLLQLQRLCNAIALSLEENLDCNSFLLTKRVANMYNLEKVEKKCDDFALNNFEELSFAEGFQDIGKDYFSFLLNSAKTTDSVKCKILIKWVNSDLVNREKYFKGMMTCLDLEKIPISYRRYLVEKENLVKGSFEVSSMFYKSIMDNCNVPSSDIRLKSKTESEDDEDNAILVFDSASSSLKTFEPETQSWKELQKMDQAFVESAFSAVVVNHSLYVLKKKRIYELNYMDSMSTWQRLPNMPVNLGSIPPTVVLNGSVYVVGTMGDVISQATLEFDPISNQWSRKSNRNVRCKYNCCATCGGYIFSIGGLHDGQAYNDVEKYNPSTDTWSSVAKMKISRCSSAAVNFRGDLYVLGGFDFEIRSEVECYNHGNDTWAMVVSMLGRRIFFKACVVNDKIYAVGGEKNETSQTVEVLDLESNKWQNIIADLYIVKSASVAIKID